MSYENRTDVGLHRLERVAGLWEIIYSSGTCRCGECEKCQSGDDSESGQRQKDLENSARFKEGAKLVAGIGSNKETALALIKRVHQDSFEAAIVRYMATEALPGYYAGIIKDPNCLERLVDGIFYKVCKMQPTLILSQQTKILSGSLRSNPDLLTAYDRVTKIQQFIHRTIDQQFGKGTALSLPVTPMKNALSAARLHLSIFDLSDGRPGYVNHIETLNTIALQLEKDKPRPSSAPPGKRTWPKWRVRHLRPFSYYFPQQRRALLYALNNLDEHLPASQFVHEALLLYAAA